MSRPREVSRRELRGVQLDPSLSLAAKGLLHELLLRPPGVVLSRAELFETNRDAMTAIDSAVEELVRAGLVMKVPTPQAQPQPAQRRHQAAGPCRRPAAARARPGWGAGYRCTAGTALVGVAGLAGAAKRGGRPSAVQRSDGRA